MSTSATKAFPLDAAYQMISCIQRLLSDDDFARIRAFASAAFHPDHASEGEPFIRTRMRSLGTARDPSEPDQSKDAAPYSRQGFSVWSVKAGFRRTRRFRARGSAARP